MKNRIEVDARLGDGICTVLESRNGRPVHIILVVLPNDEKPSPQPTFVTSFDPETMEKVFKQIAEQLTPDMIASRKVD